MYRAIVKARSPSSPNKEFYKYIYTHKNGEAFIKLKMKKHCIVVVEIQDQEKISLLEYLKAIQSDKLTLNDIFLFFDNLKMMTSSGLSLVDSLRIMSQSLSGIKKIYILNILDNLKSGFSFSESLSDEIPFCIRNVISLSEVHGGFDEALRYSSEYFSKEIDIKSKVNKHLAPLKFKLVFTFIIMALITEVMKFNPFLLNNKELSMILNYWHVALLTVLLIGLPFIRCTTMIKIYKTIPIIRRFIIIKELSLYFRTLNLMIKSGVIIQVAFNESAKSLESDFILKQFLLIRKEVRGGKSLSSLMKNVTIFDESVRYILTLADSSSCFRDAISYCSKFYDREYERIIESLISMVGISSLVILSIFIGVFSILVYGSVLQNYVSIINSIL